MRPDAPVFGPSTGSGRVCGFLAEPFGFFAPQVQRFVEDPELRHSAVHPVHDLFDAHAGIKFRKHRLSRLIVDWPAIVWIDQPQIPNLAALVCVRNSRRRAFEKRLRQAVDSPRQQHLGDKVFELRNEIL